MKSTAESKGVKVSIEIDDDTDIERLSNTIRRAVHGLAFSRESVERELGDFNNNGWD